MIDEWFPLSSYVPLKGIEPGSLRVRARYSMEKIMPEEEYSEFKEVRIDVKEHEGNTVQLLQNVPSPDSDVWFLSIPSSSCRETFMSSMHWLTCAGRTARCWPASCSGSSDTSEPKLHY